MSEKQTETKADKAEEKAQEKALKEVEAHVSPDDTEMPDHSAQRKVEAHRQSEVGPRAEVSTGDDSAVLPQPDRDAPGEPVNFGPIIDGERQSTEQPDRYAVGDEMTEYAVEPNAKNKRGRRRKKDDGSEEGHDPEASHWPAQFDGDGKEQFPAQYSW